MQTPTRAARTRAGSTCVKLLRTSVLSLATSLRRRPSLASEVYRFADEEAAPMRPGTRCDRLLLGNPYGHNLLGSRYVPRRLLPQPIHQPMQG